MHPKIGLGTNMGELLKNRIIFDAMKYDSHKFGGITLNIELSVWKKTQAVQFARSSRTLTG